MTRASAGVGASVAASVVVGAAAGLAVWIDRLPREAIPTPDGAGVALLLALALGTFASEDLACVAAGLLVARGDLGFASATAACFTGIFLGDMGLFAAGRLSGTALRRWVPLLRRLDASLLERTARWIERRGGWIVLTSRFLPGTRFPTYVGAGALGVPALPFAAWFALACAIWTPLLVGLSTLAAGGVLKGFGARSPWAVALAAFAAALTLLAAIRTLPLLGTRRGRALLRSSWTRAVRWEFWPSWAIYAPLSLTWFRLALRHRGPTVFTAANPSMPAGGFVGESKAEILEALERGGAPVARFVKIGASLAADARFLAAEGFLRESGLSFPVVVKPDVGERGAGVRIVPSANALRDALASVPEDTLVQEFVAGPELGIFWVRRPDEPRGRILSVTRKDLPEALGDGERTIEELLLAHPDSPGRVALWLDRFAHRLQEVPASGERIVLSPVGNHCRGAVFRDGRGLLTPALEKAVEAIASTVPGFHFGRFDFRAPSLEAFRAGEGLKILELNGVTSEVTHIYDPAFTLSAARAALREQWALAFEIGDANRDRGAPVTPASTLALGTFRFFLQSWKQPVPR